MDRALAIIPARAGSKGLPNKHVLTLGTRKLIEWTLQSAYDAKALTRVVVSTDSEAVEQIAQHWYEVIPRPPELATDTAGMIPVMQHAVRSVEETLGEAAPYDLIVLLQPTSPFRTGEDIDRTVSLVRESGAESGQTLVDAAYRPWPMVHLSGTRCLALFPDLAVADLRRQDPPGVYQPSGAVYVVRRDVLMEKHRIIGDDHRGLVLPWERSININGPWDFRIAEMLLARNFQP